PRRGGRRGSRTARAGPRRRRASAATWRCPRRRSSRRATPRTPLVLMLQCKMFPAGVRAGPPPGAIGGGPGAGGGGPPPGRGAGPRHPPGEETNLMRRILGAALVGAVVLAAGGVRADDEPGDKKGEFKRDPAKLFKRIDTNGDGKISKEEFKTFFENAGQG